MLEKYSEMQEENKHLRERLKQAEGGKDPWDFSESTEDPDPSRRIAALSSRVFQLQHQAELYEERMHKLIQRKAATGRDLYLISKEVTEIWEAVGDLQSEPGSQRISLMPYKWQGSFTSMPLGKEHGY